MRPLILSLLLTTPFLGAISQSHELVGRVLDATTDAPLAGATVALPEQDRGTIADATGRFTLTGVAAGDALVEIRFLGYRTERRTITLPHSEELVVRLASEAVAGDGVIVTASPTGGAATQATQAFRLEELQRRAAPSFGEMLDGASGVAMRSFGSAPARPVIRGLDGDRVLVVENGERMGDLAETAADHAVALDPLAVHRIEIVRGPASLLYGPSAVGGVINLFNEDIPQSWSPGISGQTALLGATVNSLGAVHGRLRYGAGNWAAGARLAIRGGGDIQTPEGAIPGTFLRTTSAAVGASWQPNGDQGAFFGGSLSGQTYTYGLPELVEDDDERVEIGMHRLTATGLARLPGRGVINGTEIRFSASDYGHDEIGIADGDEEVELSFHQRSASTTVTVQHSAIGPLAAGAIGVNLTVRDVVVGGEEALTPDASAFGLAVFLFEEVALTPTLRLQGGVRVDGQILNARANDQYPDFDARRATTTLSGAIGLHVSPTNLVEGGIQLARAYRLPRLEELYADSPHVGAGVFEIGNPTLGNEVALGLDGFVRSGLGPLNVEVAAFANWIDGFVAFQPTGTDDPPSGLPIHVYEPTDALLLGGELAASLRPARSIELDAQLDYVQGSRRNAESTPLPSIPPLRTRLSLAFDDGTVRLGGSARLVSAQTRVAPNEDRTDGYTLLGLEAVYRLEHGTRHVIALRVDNVLDVAYRDHLSRIEQRHAAMPGRNVVLSYQMIF